jgi:hypothetical protein
LFSVARYTAVSPPPSKRYKRSLVWVAMRTNIASGQKAGLSATVTPAASQDLAAATVLWTLIRGGEFAQCIRCPDGERIKLHIRTTEGLDVSQQCRGPEQAEFVSSICLAALNTRGWH